MSTPRKNGLLSSCEPCRASKVRCDHCQPCSRCTRTNKEAQCIYRASSATTSTRRESARIVPNSRSGPGRFLVDGDSTSYKARFPSSSPPETVASSEDASGSKKKRKVSKTGFLGLTSYSAVFSDHNNGPALLSYDTVALGSLSPTRDSCPVDSKLVHQGAQLLLHLEDISLYESVAERWFESSHGCQVLGHSLMKHIFRSVRAMAADDLKDPTASSALALSRKLFQQSAKSIPLHVEATFEEYMRSISVRWETVGLAFAFLGMGTILAPNWDSLFEQHGRSVISQKEIGFLAISAAETCLEFCNTAGLINDPLSWLSFQYTHLATLIYGDSDYHSWRALGDLSTVIFTLGLHQPDSNRSIPFWLCEVRKRLMGGSFSIDKQLATFLGRPPRISWRFCSLSLPLDLSFDELTAESKEREAAVNRLDADGWNTQGSLPKAVWLRVAILMGPIKESILELSLKSEFEDLPRKVDETIQKSHQIWNSLPPFLHWNPESHSESRPEANGYALIPMHLDWLYNDFLLYRILFKHTKLGSNALANVSLDIMSNLLMLIDWRLRDTKASSDIAWGVSFFGLPAAGVLAIELLRRCVPGGFLQPVNIPDNTPFPQSKVIQNLSVFAAHLPTVIQPHEGNYEICQNARRTIQCVLDRVLSPNPQQSEPLMQYDPSGLEFSLSTSMWDSIADFNTCISHLNDWDIGPANDFEPF